MGTIAEKLTYLNDTKQLLKENINNLGGSLTNEPFRQYASVLEGIYERLPKVSGIGASLSLSPSMVGKIKLNEIQGNTSQSGTPTPSSPVPIQSVTGEQKIELNNKNYFEISDEGVTSGTGITMKRNNDGSYTFNGTATGGGVFFRLQSPNLPTNHTLSFTSNKINSTAYVRTRNKNASLVDDLRITDLSKSISTNTEIKYTEISFADGTVVDDLTIYAQLEKGNTRTSYVPHKYNEYVINLGKQLFDKDNANIIDAYTNLTTGVILSSNNDKTIYIPCRPNTTYTVSRIKGVRFRVGFTNELPANNVVCNPYIGNKNTETEITITSINTSKYIVVNYYTGSETMTPEQILNTLQIEVGTKATSYSSYFTPIELDDEDSIKKSTGKNLFNLNTSNSNKGIDYSFNGSILSLNGTTTGEGNIYNNNSNTILLKSGTYTFSTITSGAFTRNNKDVAIYLRKKSDSSALIVLYSTANYIIDSTFTLTEDIEVYIQIYTNGSGFVFNNFNIYIMLNEGSTALPYEPYGKVWYVEKQIGKVNLEDYEYNKYGASAGYSRNTTTQIPNIKYVSVNTELGKGLCEKYQIHTGSGMSGNDAENHFAIDVSMFQVSIPNNDTPSGLLYYALATPTYTVITNTELIEQLELLYNAKSENGTTNINVTSEDLSMILNVGVLKGE